MTRMRPALLLVALAVETSACTALFPFEAPDGGGRPKGNGGVDKDGCLVGTFDPWVDDIAVDGDWVYASSGDEVFTVDVSVPSGPDTAASFSLAEESAATGLATVIAEDARAVVVGTDVGELLVLDAGAPPELTAPGFIGPLTGEITDIVIDGQLAFATRREEGGSELHVVDLGGSRIQDGIELGSSTALGVALADEVLAVALAAEGVALFEPPSGPLRVGLLDTDGSAQAVARAEGAWVVADSTSLVLWPDGQATASTILDGSQRGLEEADFLDVAMAGDDAVVAAGEAGVVVVRPTEAAPEFWHVPSARPALRVTVEGSLAYVARGNEGLAVIDLACARR